MSAMEQAKQDYLRRSRKTVPERVNQLEPRLEDLKLWLSGRGAEVLATTNVWEVVRFKAGDKLHIIYKNGQGQLTMSVETRKALTAFVMNSSWSAGVSRGRGNSKRDVVVSTLLERDGDECFLCCQPLGEDITVEHLVAIVFGGPNHIANKVLMHSKCNLRLGHMPVIQKIKMREIERSKP